MRIALRGLRCASVTSKHHSCSGRNLPSMSLNISPATRVASCHAASSSGSTSPLSSSLGCSPCVWKKYFGIDTGLTTPERQEKRRPQLGGKAEAVRLADRVRYAVLGAWPKSRKALVVLAGELKNPARSVREPERGLWRCALVEDAPWPARPSSGRVQFPFGRAHQLVTLKDNPAGVNRRDWCFLVRPFRFSTTRRPKSKKPRLTT